jgi:drug/metabolite transporter (DMT)-like permease
LSEQKTPTRATVSVLVAGVLWSFSGVLIKAVHWDFMRIAGVRSMVAAAIQFSFLVWLFRRRSSQRQSFFSTAGGAFASVFAPSKPHWLGAIAFVLNMLALAWAFRLTNATNAVFLHYSGIVLVALLSYRVLKQPLKRSDWNALALATFGIFLFCVDGFQLNAPLGTALGVSCGLTLATTQLCLGLRARDKSGENGALETILLGNLITSVIALPLILSDPTNLPPSRDWWLLLALGIFPWGLPDLIYVFAIEKVPLFRALILGLSDPILTAVWPLLFLHEYPTPLAIVGSAIVLWAIIYQANAARKLE